MLDYQFKLLGWSRFDGSSTGTSITFAGFMGRYGQLTNFMSLLFSSIAFPFLIQKYGLRQTLRLFPTLLVLVTLLTYVAVPGNLPTLFVSLALLKAMTYSVHDPSKELLYLPTADIIKFRSKFWIDVVGARIAKAVGSSINGYAGSLERIVQVGSLPSVLTAVALWCVCYAVGTEFDVLVREKRVVGLNDDDDDDDLYERLSTIEDMDDLAEALEEEEEAAAAAALEQNDDGQEGFDDEFSVEEEDVAPPMVIELPTRRR